MGRHSAPDGESAGIGVDELLRRSGTGRSARSTGASRTARRGRHFAPDAAVAAGIPEAAEAEQAAGTAGAALATRDTERIVPPEPEPQRAVTAAAATAAATAAAAATEPTVVLPTGVGEVEPKVAESAAEPAAEQVTEPVPPAGQAAAPAAAPSPAAGKTGTHADLALLRSDSTLRARCIAAVVIPFLLYAMVLLVVGSGAGSFLVWVWIPTVLAGVLVGTFLDIAHKKLENR